jgi:hypothetical protein
MQAFELPMRSPWSGMVDKQGKRMAPEDIDAVQDRDGDVAPSDGDSIQSGDGYESKVRRADPYTRPSPHNSKSFRDFETASVGNKASQQQNYQYSNNREKPQKEQSNGATSPVLFFSMVAIIALAVGAMFVRNQPDFIPLSTEASQPYQAASAGHDSDCVYEPLTAAEGQEQELPAVGASTAAPAPAPDFAL